MTDTRMKLAINGAAGRMGQRVIALAGEDEGRAIRSSEMTFGKRSHRFIIVTG